MLAYLIASYCGGLVYLISTPSSHSVPWGLFGFIMAPIQPMLIFVGIFSGAGAAFVVESVAFIAVTVVAYVLLRRLWAIKR
jgi:hypothetical protein